VELEIKLKYEDDTPLSHVSLFAARPEQGIEIVLISSLNK
jgi:hypothetical protein